MLELAPIVLKGTVVAFHDSSETIKVFGGPDHPDKRADTEKADIRVLSPLKGSSTDAVSILCPKDTGILTGFTRLKEGETYLLFLKEDDEGRLRIWDPWNGAFRVEPGFGVMGGIPPILRLKEELKYSLDSRDHVVVLTALLAIAQLGDAGALSKVLAHVKHDNPAVRAAAVGACVRLGKWRLLPDAAKLLAAADSRSDLSFLRYPPLGLQSLCVSECLAASIGSVTNAAAVPLMINLLQTAEADGRVRSQLLHSLAEIGDQRAVGIFLPMLDAPDADTSYMAYKALIKAMGENHYSQDSMKGERREKQFKRIREWASGKLKEQGP